MTMPAQTKNVNSLFAPAKVTSAYLKAGLTGFAGSGKTRPPPSWRSVSSS
jgi:hypothetical protein